MQCTVKMGSELVGKQIRAIGFARRFNAKVGQMTAASLASLPARALTPSLSGLHPPSPSPLFALVLSPTLQVVAVKRPTLKKARYVSKRVEGKLPDIVLESGDEVLLDVRECTGRRASGSGRAGWKAV